jgi:hypothetical protein
MTSTHWALDLLEEILIDKMNTILKLNSNQSLEMVQIYKEQNKFNIRYRILNKYHSSKDSWLHSEWHNYDSEFTLKELIEFLSETE